MSNNEKFRSTVGTILGIPEEQVTDDLSSETVDTWDSLNHINLIGALEQEFGLVLGANSLDDCQSVAQLKALLTEHGVALD
jgi:acyl carrier protein